MREWYRESMTNIEILADVTRKISWETIEDFNIDLLEVVDEGGELSCRIECVPSEGLIITVKEGTDEISSHDDGIE